MSKKNKLNPEILEKGIEEIKNPLVAETSEEVSEQIGEAVSAETQKTITELEAELARIKDKRNNSETGWIHDANIRRLEKQIFELKKGKLDSKSSVQESVSELGIADLISALQKDAPYNQIYSIIQNMNISEKSKSESITICKNIARLKNLKKGAKNPKSFEEKIKALYLEIADVDLTPASDKVDKKDVKIDTKTKTISPENQKLIDEKSKELEKRNIIASTATDKYEAKQNIDRLTKEIEEIKNGKTLTGEESKSDKNEDEKKDSKEDVTVKEKSSTSTDSEKKDDSKDEVVESTEKPNKNLKRMMWVFDFEDGKYEGEKDEDGIPNGSGKFTSKGGTILGGTFENGQLKEGSMHFIDGTVNTGEYDKNGNLLNGVIVNPNGRVTKVVNGHHAVIAQGKKKSELEKKQTSTTTVSKAKEKIFEFVDKRNKLKLVFDGAAIPIESDLKEGDKVFDKNGNVFVVDEVLTSGADRDKEFNVRLIDKDGKHVIFGKNPDGTDQTNATPKILREHYRMIPEGADVFKLSPEEREKLPDLHYDVKTHIENGHDIVVDKNGTWYAAKYVNKNTGGTIKLIDEYGNEHDVYQHEFKDYKVLPNPFDTAEPGKGDADPIKEEDKEPTELPNLDDVFKDLNLGEVDATLVNAEEIIREHFANESEEIRRQIHAEGKNDTDKPRWQKWGKLGRFLARTTMRGNRIDELLNKELDEKDTKARKGSKKKKVYLASGSTKTGLSKDEVVAGASRRALEAKSGLDASFDAANLVNLDPLAYPEFFAALNPIAEGYLDGTISAEQFEEQFATAIQNDTKVSKLMDDSQIKYIGGNLLAQLGDVKSKRDVFVGLKNLTNEVINSDNLTPEQVQQKIDTLLGTFNEKQKAIVTAQMTDVLKNHPGNKELLKQYLAHLDGLTAVNAKTLNMKLSLVKNARGAMSVDNKDKQSKTYENLKFLEDRRIALAVGVGGAAAISLLGTAAVGAGASVAIVAGTKTILAALAAGGMSGIKKYLHYTKEQVGAEKRRVRDEKKWADRVAEITVPGAQDKRYSKFKSISTYKKTREKELYVDTMHNMKPSSELLKNLADAKTKEQIHSAMNDILVRLDLWRETGHNYISSSSSTHEKGAVEKDMNDLAQALVAVQQSTITDDAGAPITIADFAALRKESAYQTLKDELNADYAEKAKKFTSQRTTLGWKYGIGSALISGGSATLLQFFTDAGMFAKGTAAIPGQVREYLHKEVYESFKLNGKDQLDVINEMRTSNKPFWTILHDVMKANHGTTDGAFNGLKNDFMEKFAHSMTDASNAISNELLQGLTDLGVKPISITDPTAVSHLKYLTKSSIGVIKSSADRPQIVDGFNEFIKTGGKITSTDPAIRQGISELAYMYLDKSSVHLEAIHTYKKVIEEAVKAVAPTDNRWTGLGLPTFFNTFLPKQGITQDNLKKDPSGKGANPNDPNKKDDSGKGPIGPLGGGFKDYGPNGPKPTRRGTLVEEGEKPVFGEKGITGKKVTPQTQGLNGELPELNGEYPGKPSEKTLGELLTLVRLAKTNPEKKAELDAIFKGYYGIENPTEEQINDMLVKERAISKENKAELINRIRNSGLIAGMSDYFGGITKKQEKIILDKVLDEITIVGPLESLIDGNLIGSFNPKTGLIRIGNSVISSDNKQNFLEEAIVHEMVHALSIKNYETFYKGDKSVENVTRRIGLQSQGTLIKNNGKLYTKHDRPGYTASSVDTKLNIVELKKEKGRGMTEAITELATIEYLKTKGINLTKNIGYEPLVKSLQLFATTFGIESNDLIKLILDRKHVTDFARRLDTRFRLKKGTDGKSSAVAAEKMLGNNSSILLNLIAAFDADHDDFVKVVKGKGGSYGTKVDDLIKMLQKLEKGETGMDDDNTSKPVPPVPPVNPEPNKPNKDDDKSGEKDKKPIDDKSKKTGVEDDNTSKEDDGGKEPKKLEKYTDAEFKNGKLEFERLSTAQKYTIVNRFLPKNSDSYDKFNSSTSKNFDQNVKNIIALIGDRGFEKSDSQLNNVVGKLLSQVKIAFDLPTGMHSVLTTLLVDYLLLDSKTPHVVETQKKLDTLIFSDSKRLDPMILGFVVTQIILKRNGVIESGGNKLETPKVAWFVDNIKNRGDKESKAKMDIIMMKLNHFVMYNKPEITELYEIIGKGLVDEFEAEPTIEDEKEAEIQLKTKAFEIEKKYLSYGKDVGTLEDYIQKNSIESNNVQIALELGSLLEGSNSKTVHEMAQNMQMELLSIATKNGINLSEYATVDPCTRAYWDIAKQSYLSKNPSKTSKKYNTDVFNSKTVTNDIVMRHLGWELNHYNTKLINSDEKLKHLFESYQNEKSSKYPEDQLASYAYTELGYKTMLVLEPEGDISKRVNNYKKIMKYIEDNKILNRKEIAKIEGDAFEDTQELINKIRSQLNYKNMPLQNDLGSEVINKEINAKIEGIKSVIE